MKLNNKEIKAAIFDMDGTLVDSTLMWADIDKEFFAKRGMEVPSTYQEEIMHIGLKQAAILTKNKYGIKESIEEIEQEWINASKDMYENKVLLKNNAYELLTYLKDNNIKLALATANSKEMYEPCLKRLKIYDFFDVILDVHSVSKGKDNILLYETISNKLGINKENTLVLEDIPVGLKTAFEGGYITIGVDDIASRNVEDIKKKYSHKYIYDFFDLISILHL